MKLRECQGVRTDDFAGTIKYPIKGKDGEIHETGSLVDASKGKWKGMMNRLAQQDIVEK